MDLIKFMQKRANKIEELKEELFELKYDSIGAEVMHEGNEAIIMEIDWENREVLLNYDDVNMEWVSFE